MQSSPATTRHLAIAAAACSLLLVSLLAWWPRELPPSTAAPPVGTAPAVARADAHDDVVRPQSERVEQRPRVEPAKVTPAAGRQSMGMLVGRVLLDTRMPASGAEVRVGAQLAIAAADGGFELRRDRAGAGDDLVATRQGWQPAVIVDLAQTAVFRAGGEIEVVLPGKAWGIDGWLVDPTGAPCTGWNLELYRGTGCGQVGFPNVLAEDLAAGAQVQVPEAMSLGHRRMVNPNLQQIGTDGAFRIGGLRRGCDYVLRAWNPRTLQTVFSAPIAAGISRYVFTVPPADCRERVTGRAVDRYGNALASVRVRLSMREHQSGGQTSYQTGQEVRTGLDGSFEFRQVPRQDLLLRFTGDDVESNDWELKGDDPGVDLRVRLVCICRFRFEARATAADALRILDGEDRPLRLTLQLGEGQSTGGTDVAIVEGRSPELTVIDAAAWLSLSRGREVVQRVPIKLYRGELAVLRD